MIINAMKTHNKTYNLSKKYLLIKNIYLFFIIKLHKYLVYILIIS